MKNEWKTTTLGEAFTTQTGNTPPKNNAGFYGDFIPLVKPPELRDSPFDSAEDGLSEAGAAVARTLPPQSILVSCIGNLGKIGLNVVPVAFNQQINAILPDKGQAIPEFMFFQVLSREFKEQLESLASGTTVPIVNKAKFNSIKIVLPPLPEQRRIVGILDEAFEGIATAKAHAEENLQNARALFESHLQSVFTQRGPGWLEKPLGSFATFRNGINYTKESKGERIKIVGVRNFQKNFSAPMDDLDLVTIDGILSEIDSLKQDDILAVRSNGNIELIGRSLLVGEVADKISHSGFTIRIRLLPGEVLPSYLCHFMKSASTRKRLTEGGTGTNIKSLNQGMLSVLTVPFPPVSAQKLIVEKLEDLSEETQRLKSIYQQKLAALEALKKSLLHQAFTGAL